jgi:RNA polymerase sigma-70 factor (ECF subfamily)
LRDNFEIAARKRKVTDEELARAHLEGNRDAFRELVLRYQSRIVTLLYRYTHDQGIAEDLGQESFLRLYRALPRVDLAQPLKPYLYRIAVNAARDWARRGSSMSVALDEDDDLPDEQSDNVDERLSLEDAVMRLPMIYRETVTLHYGMGLGYGEIAQWLGISEETVRTRLRRALAQLRKLIK